MQVELDAVADKFASIVGDAPPAAEKAEDAPENQPPSQKLDPAPSPDPLPPPPPPPPQDEK